MIEYNVRVQKSGAQEWYHEGLLHREDGPAIILASGTKEWYKHGELHREDGPAVEYADGTKEWYKNGKRHREDGPAIEYSGGSKDWYLDDKKLTETEWKAKINKKAKLDKTCDGKIVDIDGVKYKMVKL